MPTPAEVRELLQPVLEPPTVDFNLPKSILGWFSLVFGLILMVGLTFFVLTATITETGNGEAVEVGKKFEQLAFNLIPYLRWQV